MHKGLQQLYTGVPHTYEFLNHLLTLGLDVRWRKKAAELAAGGGGTYWLDVGIGTGEMAANLCKLASPQTQVIALDFILPMMQQALRKQSAEKIRFILGEAAHLPFRNGSIDVITISFALRNIHSSGPGKLMASLKEFQRVLKPGGNLVILESSQPEYRAIRSLFHLYVKLTVGPIGAIISGSRPAYAYLSRSMRRFHSAETLAGILQQAGFTEVRFTRLLLGATAIHWAEKQGGSNALGNVRACHTS